MTAAEYFEIKHMRLMSAPDISCGPRARTMAMLLLGEGHVGVALLKIEPAHRSDAGEEIPLLPRVYDAVEWGAHIICVAGDGDGTVYDPILPEPLPRNEYRQAMFGDQAIRFTPYATTEALRADA